MKNFIILFLFTGFMACNTVKTNFDYDKQADFSKYKTYSLTDDNLDKTVGQLNGDRIIKAVEEQLANKGFTESSDPDVLVDVYVKSKEEQEATATTMGDGVGYGPYGYRFGGGFSTTQVDYNTYTVGTLFISMIDNSTKKIVWQGTGAKTINDNSNTEQKEENITNAVQQIMMNYPPKS